MTKPLIYNKDDIMSAFSKQRSRYGGCAVNDG